MTIEKYSIGIGDRFGRQADAQLKACIMAAERGVKTAYAVKGHSCDEDAEDEPPAAGPAKPEAGSAGQTGTRKPQ